MTVTNCQIFFYSLNSYQLNVFSINSNNCVLKVRSIAGVLYVHLISSPLLLQLLVHGLHGLLGVKAQPVLLPFHLEKLFSMGL